MTIWILAILIMMAVALAGWRQGAIRAAFAFVGILENGPHFALQIFAINE